jgi:hypothetical protein
MDDVTLLIMSGGSSNSWFCLQVASRIDSIRGNKELVSGEISTDFHLQVPNNPLPDRRHASLQKLNQEDRSSRSSGGAQHKKAKSSCPEVSPAAAHKRVFVPSVSTANSKERCGFEPVCRVNPELKTHCQAERYSRAMESRKESEGSPGISQKEGPTVKIQKG